MSEMRGIKFTDITSGVSKHTADDWDLIMSEKIIGMPAPRILKVDMVDRDGDLDLSEVNRGRVSYENRALSFSFTCTAHYDTWADLRTEIAGFLHGKRMQIEDPDTPGQYYTGRCTLQEPSFIGEAIMFLTVTVDADPYRLDAEETTVIETGGFGHGWMLKNKTMPVVPTITVSADMTLRFGTSLSVALLAGTTYRIPETVLAPGSNIVTIIAGSGTVTSVYRQGDI